MAAVMGDPDAALPWDGCTLHGQPAAARHDWEIFRELGLRYGKRFPRQWLKAQRLRLTPNRIIDVLLRLGPYRLPLKKLKQHPHGIDLGPLAPTGPHKIDLTPRLLVDAARDVADMPTPQGLLLIGRRHLRANNSWMNDIPRLTKGKVRHHLLMHPDDCAGIRDGVRTVRCRGNRSPRHDHRRHHARRGEPAARLLAGQRQRADRPESP
ncbi:Formate dehydrogenase-O, major subunit [Alloactinosynnema sp. L-07]|nr:Formate dehydrogenase-O, major subunit [Alloactinosynnema sp. L-07]